MSKSKNYFTDDAGKIRRPVEANYGQVEQEVLANDPGYLRWLDEIEAEMKKRREAQS